MAATAGTSGRAARTSRADTRSPVVTGDPCSTAATMGPTSMPPSTFCAVSAVARNRGPPAAPRDPLWAGVGGPPPQQVLEHRLFAALLTGLELELSAQHVDDRLEVDDPCHRVPLTQHRGPLLGGRRDGFRGRDREPRGHPGTLVDRPGFAQITGEAGENLQQVVGNL